MSQNLQPIPVNQPWLCGREKELLAQCIESGWISSEGPFVAQFEQQFAEKVGRKQGIAVANGSAALDIAVQALNLGRGDEVILPAFTIISPAASIVRAGATPVLVDSDPVTWNMDVEQIAARITPRTKAILPVHIYGLPVDMDPLLALARRHGLAVIEDAAEMHGQTYRRRPCGSFGDLSVFSFYPNKLITTGEGGMIVTDDARLAERCRSLRNLCFKPERRFVHDELGWNYRMSNIQAALGLAQLEQWDERIRRKREMGGLYSEALADVRAIRLPLTATEFAQNIYWVFGVVLDDALSLDAAEMTKCLAEQKVGTRPFFWPMHEQPVFNKMGLFAGEHYPVASQLARRGFYLPSGVGSSKEEILLAAARFKAIIETL